MPRLLSIIGNRPHFIKLAPVYHALKKYSDIEHKIVHTGQHYDKMLSAHFIKELNIPEPDENLNVGSGRPLQQIASILIGLDTYIDTYKPDMIIVYGDTNSTAAGAISAAKTHIPLAHVESGLREYSKQIPEEINKLITDSVTDLFFCPTQTGEKNLINDGKGSGVYLVGDVGLDLVQQSSTKIKEAESALDELKVKKNQYVFMTCHRASNTDDLENIKNILAAANNVDKDIVFPIHPRTKKVIEDHGLSSSIKGEKWKTMEPIGFFKTQALIKNAEFCLTDSGGIIKESYFHKTPCIIIDKQTEWIEAVQEGWCHISGPDEEKILEVAKNIHPPSTHYNSLGDGTASKQIAEIINSYLKNKI